MSAAQLMATQVGEVAGIQVVLTIQESIARGAGLGNVHPSPALLHSFRSPFWVGAGVAATGGGLRPVHPVDAPWIAVRTGPADAG